MNNQLKYYTVDLAGDCSIEVRDFGHSRYICYFCLPKDSSHFNTRGFGVIDDDAGISIFPENNGKLDPQTAKHIWSQIRERLDKPEDVMTIPDKK